MAANKGKIFFVVFFLSLFFLISFLDILAGPFVISFIAAYLLNPIFEKLGKKGFKRTHIAVFLVTTLSCVFLFLIRNLYPLILDQINSLLTFSPHLKSYLEQSFFPKISGLLSDFTNQTDQNTQTHIYDVFSIDVKKIGDSFFSSLGPGSRYVVSKLFMIVIAPLFLFFLMRDLPKIYAYIFSLVPNQVKPIFMEFVTEVDVKLTKVLRGQCFVILLLCVLYPLALLIAGLPSAIAVGVIIGLSKVIPYMDIVMGILISSFVLLTNNASNELILSVFVAFLIVQCLDAFFITPRIMGKISGLHPFVVILAVICFGNWFGFWGVLLAIPSAAILKVAFTMIINTYRESGFFKDGCSK